MAGLADLLMQLGIDNRKCAEDISTCVLSHPLIAGANQRLGLVIQREEFTELLLDFASDNGASRRWGATPKPRSPRCCRTTACPIRARR